MKDVRGFWREHAVALTVSIILHLALAGAVVYGWWHWHNQPQPLQPLPIQATVVDEAAINRESAKLEAAAQAERDQAVAVKREAQEEARKLEDLKRQREEAEQAQRAETEREQQAAADAQAKAQADAAAQAKRKRDSVKQAADRKRKAQETKQRADAEAELKNQLEAEERRQAAVNSGALADYMAQIQERIQHAWNRPGNVAPGLDCTVYITQVPGGTVTSAKLGVCNGDDAVRESILAAVYRASPLPRPSNPDLFDRNLKVPFRPDN